MNKSRFAKVEEQIQQLVEGSFARLFAGRLAPRDVAVRLARALEDHVERMPDGTLIAPTVFTVHLNPDDHTAILEAAQRLEATFADVLLDFANRADMRMLRRPAITLVPDETLSLRAIRVEAYHEERPVTDTQALSPINTNSNQQPKKPRDPHVILHGATYVPLDRQVINIGRRHNNHIVIDDARVSRAHAQIRLRFGSYVIYDLGSRGGTLVNNHLIQEHILKSGDVISLAGVTMIYVEDESSTDQNSAGDSNQDLGKTDINMQHPNVLTRPSRDSDATL